LNPAPLNSSGDPILAKKIRKKSIDGMAQVLKTNDGWGWRCGSVVEHLSNYSRGPEVNPQFWGKEKIDRQKYLVNSTGIFLR
jgi:hypothetical protein